jgi:hypothetical protein
VSYAGSTRQRQFEISTHYATLKALNGGDPVSAVVRTCGFEDGAVVYAKRFWHVLFDDLPELRKLFPEYAERFGPYGTSVE